MIFRTFERMSGKKIFLAAVFLSVALNMPAQNTEHPMENFGIVIHGGAGTILRKNMRPEIEKAYRDKLTEAVQLAYDTLQKGASSVDAVCIAINVLEDSPLFNAGKGAVFTHAGTNEMDASIMSGVNKQAGAVAGVKTIKNPINAAKAVMQHSEHVMMVGDGAEQFAKEQGLEMVDPEYFKTEKRLQQLEKIKSSGQSQLDHSSENPLDEEFNDRKYGTVGAVALDKNGNLAAGTSTGGMTNKKYGRVGDSPIIGAGTYADNKTCAVSATGHGEFFIRAVVAYDIAARMEYAGETLKEASNEVIMKKLVKEGGSGGVIAMDAKGNISMPFNTPGMYRAFVKADGKIEVFIYDDEN